jgi:hypothetical protein
MGILLTIIAIIISAVLVPIGMLYGIIKHLLGINKKALNIALWIDIGGNVLCAELFNDLLIKNSDINPFGSPYQTISEVLGINNQLLNLTKTGQGLTNLLHYLDPYHVEKSIGINVPNIVLTKKQLIFRFAVVLLSILTIIAAILTPLLF